jgi:valyl-tRNA synthetase
MKDIPFRDVYIHGTVRDVEGKKMSKSLGNIIDPLEIIKEYGADALRFSLISSTAQGQDVFLSKEKFQQGRNFANKIWNASRFILMNLEGQPPKPDLCEFFKKEDLSLINRWILSRFYSTLKELGTLLDGYKFNEAANLLYGFFWHEFCDWYLEMIKPDIKNPHNQLVMYKVLEKFLRALHPFMPFITEDIWQRLANSGSIMVQSWPHLQEQMIDRRLEARMEEFLAIITTIRNMRQELEIPLQQETELIIATADQAKRQFLDSLAPLMRPLAKVRGLKIEAKYSRVKSSATALIKDIHISLPLAGVVDIAKESAKLEERILKAQSDIRSKEKTLANKEFLKNAPQEIVSGEKEKLKELQDLLKRLQGLKNELR